ncbi:MAG: ribosomal protein S18-alanine N-acetyltransferase [Terriglobales bacterium]
MTIRPATPADIPRLIPLERHSATAAHWAEADYQRLFDAGAPERLALVLEEAEIVAFIVARGIAAEWEIENVAVAGPARRRGLGTRLLGELLNRLRARGVESVFLEVRESNVAARMLYEKWAFEESGRRTGYYRDPAEDAIQYRLSFP